MDYTYIPYDFRNWEICDELTGMSLQEKDSGEPATIETISYDDSAWDAYDGYYALVNYDDGEVERFSAKDLLEYFLTDEGEPVGRKVSVEEANFHKSEEEVFSYWREDGASDASIQKAMGDFTCKLLKASQSGLMDKLAYMKTVIEEKDSYLRGLQEELNAFHKKYDDLEKEFNDYKESIEVHKGDFMGHLLELHIKYDYEVCPLCNGTGVREIIYVDNGEKGTVTCSKTITHKRYYLKKTEETFAMIYDPESDKKLFVCRSGTSMYSRTDAHGNEWYEYSSTSYAPDLWFKTVLFATEEEALKFLRSQDDFTEDSYIGILTEDQE